MFKLDRYKAIIREDIENITFAFFDLLIEEERRRPGITEVVLSQAKIAVAINQFNLYRPSDRDAWYVIAQPIRTFVDPEYARLHMLSIMIQVVSDHVADEQVMRQEKRVRQFLAS